MILLNKRDIALGITIFLGAATGLFAFRWVQLGACFLAWKLQREQPRLAMVPQSLRDTSVSEGNGMSFPRFGYEFEAPWKDVERIDDYSSIVRIRFKSGQFIVFYDPKESPDLVKTMRDAAAAKGRDIREVFDADAMESNYKLMSAELSMTPSQISVWMPARQAIRDAIFLTLKQIEIVYAETGLFSLQTPHLRGFQKGDPSRAALVIVDAFDDQDRRYRFLIGVEKGKGATVTQPEINKILQTVHPVSEARVTRDRK